MTPFEKLVVYKAAHIADIPTRTQALELMLDHKIEKLPIVVEKENKILAVIHLKDIEKESSY